MLFCRFGHSETRYSLSTNGRSTATGGLGKAPVKRHSATPLLDELRGKEKEPLTGGRAALLRPAYGVGGSFAGAGHICLSFVPRVGRSVDLFPAVSICLPSCTAVGLLMLILWIEMRRSGILRQFLWSGTSRVALDNKPIKNEIAH